VTNVVLHWLSFRDYNSKQGFLRIANFFVLLCVIVHNITCYLYLLAQDEDIPIETTYLQNNALEKDQVYAKTLYYVITTISTVGYGDIYPRTSKEIAFVMFIQFLGVVIFAYLTGNITSILMNLNLREKSLSEKEINLDKWFIDLSSHHKYKISPELQRNIKDYFMYFWENDHSTLISQSDFLMRMPQKLRHEFMDYLFADELKYFKIFFSDYELNLRYVLMLNMYPRIFEDKAPIIKAGEEVDEIYLIRRGKVVLSTKIGISFLVLATKSFFGEEFALFGKLPKINFSAEEYGVECFCLKKSKYLELVGKYPSCYQLILKRAFKRAKYFKAVMQSSVKKEEIGYDELNLMKNKSMKSGAGEYLANFTWEFDESELNELNEMIAKGNEMSVKEKIVENVRKGQQNMASLQENIESISTQVEEIKMFYERDINSLVHVINLLKDGHQLEADSVLRDLKITLK
jgi:CRP-like cAMP-binding protein